MARGKSNAKISTEMRIHLNIGKREIILKQSAVMLRAVTPEGIIGSREEM